MFKRTYFLGKINEEEIKQFEKT